MKELDGLNIPKHLAIIMDGNGRWAKARGLPRNLGHKAGIEAAKAVTKAAHELKIEYLTLFGFSTENWRRPAEEVNELMRLMRMYLRAETAELHKQNVKIRMIGFREELSKDINELIDQAEELTKNNTGLQLSIAFNYGGKQDILQAAAKMAQDIQANELGHDDITSSLFNQYLLTKDLPDPDLIVRTSGENRLSNFMLWQGAYSELVFSDVFWPDFNKKDLIECITDYSERERRFGSVKVS